jgi:hypothetical protein
MKTSFYLFIYVLIRCLVTLSIYIYFSLYLFLFYLFISFSCVSFFVPLDQLVCHLVNDRRCWKWLKSIDRKIKLTLQLKEKHSIWQISTILSFIYLFESKQNLHKFDINIIYGTNIFYSCYFESFNMVLMDILSCGIVMYILHCFYYNYDLLIKCFRVQLFYFQPFHKSRWLLWLKYFITKTRERER